MSENPYSFVCFLTGHGLYDDDGTHPLDVLTTSQTDEIMQSLAKWGGERLDYAKVVVLVYGGACRAKSEEGKRRSKLREVADWVDGLGYYCALFVVADWSRVQAGSASLAKWASKQAVKRITRRRESEKGETQWIQPSLF